MTIEQAKYKLLSYAMEQLGYREGPNNWNKYAAEPAMTQLLGWNAQNQPWCNVFVNACFVACFGLEIGAAMLYQPIGGGSALCRASADFFKAACAWIERGRMPEPGDVIFFYRSGDINHMGIVSRVAGGSVVTIEGNSSDSVAERCYSISDTGIAGYGRPQWALAADAEDTNVPAKDVTNTNVGDKPAEPIARRKILRQGMFGDDVRELQEKLNKLGYNVTIDGKYGIKTFIAVCAFQEDHGIEVDGEAGPVTMSIFESLDLVDDACPINGPCNHEPSTSETLKLVAEYMRTEEFQNRFLAWVGGHHE